jgi:ribonuclease Z
MLLRQAGISLQKIQHVFISHLHGDHYFGLIGLVNSMHLLGRKKELHLYAVAELQKLIDLQLELSGTVLSYPLVFHAIDPDMPCVIMEDEWITVSTLPLNHRIPTCGFLISEKPDKRKIRKEFVKKAKIPLEFYARIKDGEDFVDEQGRVYPNEQITHDPPETKSYAYCSDTACHEPVVPLIRGCDLLYHEATFMDDMAKTAREKYHSTAREAATIAAKAEVKRLLIGHFSARYNDAQGLLSEAQEVFPETLAAEDGMVVLV